MVQDFQFSPDGRLVFATLPERGGALMGFDARTGRAITPPWGEGGNRNGWFRVRSQDEAGPLILLEKGELGGLQVVRWSGSRWVEEPAIADGERLAVADGLPRTPTSLEARQQHYYLGPEGTTFLEENRLSEQKQRPNFGFSPDGRSIYAAFRGGKAGVWDARGGLGAG